MDLFDSLDKDAFGFLMAHHDRIVSEVFNSEQGHRQLDELKQRNFHVAVAEIGSADWWFANYLDTAQLRM